MKNLRKHQRGAALIMVLWTSLLVSLILSVILLRTRSEAEITRAQLERVQGQAAMEGAALHAAYRMMRSRRNEAVLPFTVDLGAHEVTVRLSPQMQKIDINLASEARLRDFFLQGGMERVKAEGLAARIADWRDADDLTRINGAERGDYLMNGGPRNGPFLSVQELTLVRDLPEEFFEAYGEALTVVGADRVMQEQNMRLLPGMRVTLQSKLSHLAGEGPPPPAHEVTFRALGRPERPLEAVR
ncbi:MAG: hypothetical protein AAF603_03720 [Pseudomonadota bacterium]